MTNHIHFNILTTLSMLFFVILVHFISKKYAKILGYNYNSSEWYEEAYKILNKDYKKFKKTDIKKDNNLFKKIIEKIK